MRKHFAALAAAGLAALITGAGAMAADFYAGKRLTILINFAAGGPTDIEGRLLARHIGKHIPGNPNIVVQNMDGAGGLVGTNYIGEVAPKDGTTLGYLTGAGMASVVARDRMRVDFLTYGFVGYQPVAQIYFVRKDVAPGINTPADIFKAQNLVVGGLAADSSKDLQLRLLADIMGLKYKYVTAYKGSAGARLAMERGEINMFAESVPGYRAQVEPSLIAKGLAIPVFADPGWNGSQYYVPFMAKGFPDIPPFHEFYEKATGKPPSGPAWNIFRSILAFDSQMARLITFPPGVPKEAISILQDSVRKLNTDKEFAADAEKLVNFVPNYEANENIHQIIAGALKVSDADRQWIADYIKNAPR